MKATMVEFVNDDNCWTWYKVWIGKSPKEAIGDYLTDHFEPEDIEGWEKDITEDGGEYYYDEVRAYEINIEE